MEIKNNLKEKIKTELITCAKSFDKEQMNSFLQWMMVEYKNYFSITRESALKTLRKLRERYNSYDSLISVLENNIDEYSSLECYYILSLELAEEWKQLNK